jgi:hypothetical protein
MCVDYTRPVTSEEGTLVIIRAVGSILHARPNERGRTWITMQIQRESRSFISSAASATPPCRLGQGGCSDEPTKADVLQDICLILP